MDTFWLVLYPGCVCFCALTVLCLVTVHFLSLVVENDGTALCFPILRLIVESAKSVALYALFCSHASVDTLKCITI